MPRALALLALVLSISAQAQITPDNSAGGPFGTSFEDLVNGTNYDGVLISGGVGFAERFSGQTLTDVSGFDQLSSAPTAPLVLQTGAAGRNLQALDFDAGGGTALGGLGSAGFGVPGAFGNGSVAMYFSTDQSEILFFMFGFGGTANFDFYRRDGSLIQSLTVGSLNQQPYGFRRNGGVNDIAGVSIWSTDDPTGISFDYINHDVASAVPEPATALLLLGGIGALAVRLRRR